MIQIRAIQDEKNSDQIHLKSTPRIGKDWTRNGPPMTGSHIFFRKYNYIMRKCNYLWDNRIIRDPINKPKTVYRI
jgi:hypothetical protein